MDLLDGLFQGSYKLTKSRALAKAGVFLMFLKISDIYILIFKGIFPSIEQSYERLGFEDIQYIAQS